MAPTPPMPPMKTLYAYPVARRQEHQGLLQGMPSAAEIYAVVEDRSRPLQPMWVEALAAAAPMLTLQQLEYILEEKHRPDWPRVAHARLKYIHDLKRRVREISEDWGSIVHVLQTHMIAMFLAGAVHLSLDRRQGLEALLPEGQLLASMRRVASHAEEGIQVAEAVDEDGIGGSLLGPEDVAALLRSGLASALQSYMEQQNFRMLIELTLSQPPIFLRGVLYELSDNGAQRNLAQVLLRLVDVRQDAFLEPIDIAGLFEQHLGVAIPRRSDYMAGGRWSRQSYYQEMFHAASMILEEAEPYLAVQSHVQVAWLPEHTTSLAATGLDARIEMQTQRAQATIRRADECAQVAYQLLCADKPGALSARGFVHAVTGGLVPAGRGKCTSLSTCEVPEVIAAVAAYREAFAACRAVLRLDPSITIGRDWFKSFWQRNYEALMLECILRNVQDDVDNARKWFAVQPGVAELSPESHKWGTGGWENEQWLIDVLIDITYYFPEDRARIRSDPLTRLLLCNDPADRYDFTVISVMGVISQGAEGLELEATYKRYNQRRGVTFIRADTGTVKKHEYNAEKIEEAIRKVPTQTWGIIGYSQGAANSLKTESRLCGGTPEQRALVSGLRCRNLLFPAANGTTQATCAEWKVTKVIVELERLLKHQQALISSSLSEAFLELCWRLCSSKGLVSFMGGLHSLGHSCVHTFWREAQHKDGVPTMSIRGVVEEHTLPECLGLMNSWGARQLESPLHDTQVALVEAVGHPAFVHNENSAMLTRCDLSGAVQRLSHWAPLDEATESITTESDLRRHIYDVPKDRLVYPWLELNARFGFVPKVADDAERDWALPASPHRVDREVATTCPMPGRRPSVPEAPSLSSAWRPRETPLRSPRSAGGPPGLPNDRLGKPASSVRSAGGSTRRISRSSR